MGPFQLYRLGAGRAVAAFRARLSIRSLIHVVAGSCLVAVLASTGLMRPRSVLHCTWYGTSSDRLCSLRPLSSLRSVDTTVLATPS